MNIADQLTTIANNVPLVYNAGYNKGKAEGGGITPFYYASTLANTFKTDTTQPVVIPVTFPENYNFNLYVKYGVPITSMFEGAKGLQSVKLKSTENIAAISASYFIRNCTSVQTVDLSEYNTVFNSVIYFAQNCEYLQTIEGVLDTTACTNFAGFIAACKKLQKIRFEKESILYSISFGAANSTTGQSLDRASLESIVYGLSTGVSGKTASFSATAVAKAFETSTGANDGVSNLNSDWYKLTANRQNWTITTA